MKLILEKAEKRLTELAEEILSELGLKYSDNTIESLIFKVEKIKLFLETYPSRVDVVLDEILKENSVQPEDSETRKQLHEIANAIAFKYRDIIL